MATPSLPDTRDLPRRSDRLEKSPTRQGGGLDNELDRLIIDRRIVVFNDTVSRAPNARTLQTVERMSEMFSHRGDLPKRLFNPDVTDGAFRMYIYMSVLINAGDHDFNRQAMAEHLGVSTRTIYTRERNLIDTGLLLVVPEYEGEARVGTSYWLTGGDEG